MLCRTSTCFLRRCNKSSPSCFCRDHVICPWPWISSTSMASEKSPATRVGTLLCSLSLLNHSASMPRLFSLLCECVPLIFEQMLVDAFVKINAQSTVNNVCNVMFPDLLCVLCRSLEKVFTLWTELRDFHLLIISFRCYHSSHVRSLSFNLKSTCYLPSCPSDVIYVLLL
jgi:hypothetical protein